MGIKIIFSLGTWRFARQWSRLKLTMDPFCWVRVLPYLSPSVGALLAAARALLAAPHPDFCFGLPKFWDSWEGQDKLVTSPTCAINLQVQLVCQLWFCPLVWFWAALQGQDSFECYLLEKFWLCMVLRCLTRSEQVQISFVGFKKT